MKQPCLLETGHPDKKRGGQSDREEPTGINDAYKPHRIDEGGWDAVRCLGWKSGRRRPELLLHPPSKDGRGGARFLMTDLAPTLPRSHCAAAPLLLLLLGRAAAAPAKAQETNPLPCGCSDVDPRTEFILPAVYTCW